MRKRWTKASALAAFLDEADRLGRTPTLLDLRKKTRVCSTDRTLIRLFGSWRSAMKAAGFSPRLKGGQVGWRKSHCRWGHARTGANLDTQGHCKQCAKQWRQHTSRKPSLVRESPQILAARITESKKRWWSRIERGRNPSPVWVHPYRRSA